MLLMKRFKVGDDYYCLTLNLSDDCTYILDKEGNQRMSFTPDGRALNQTGAHLGGIGLCLHDRNSWHWWDARNPQVKTCVEGVRLPYAAEAQLAAHLIEHNII